ncbi:unnamed protein product [Cuscuta europaea]|uniref:Uncharacterized protein n=1 Tax=Cuscuta europaea TaxID=41803 RepID=A0A9P0Z7Q9_CUSEU|nr:unnamed protein product [Cuscuta europaea]
MEVLVRTHDEHFVKGKVSKNPQLGPQEQTCQKAIQQHCKDHWDHIDTIMRITYILHQDYIYINVIPENTNVVARYIGPGMDVKSSHFLRILKFDAIGFPYVV